MKWSERGTEHWDDVDWCYDNVNPESLSDTEILRILPLIHPYSGVVAGLLYQAGRRGLGASLPAARKYVDHPDPEVAIEAAQVIRLFGTPEDAQRLVELAKESPREEHLFAALVEAAVALDPKYVPVALQVADAIQSVVLKAGVVLAIPKTFLGLDNLLLELANSRDLPPGIKGRVLSRLSELPHTPQIESFFVSLAVDDDGTDPHLSAIIDSALSRTSSDGSSSIS